MEAMNRFNRYDGARGCGCPPGDPGLVPASTFELSSAKAARTRDLSEPVFVPGQGQRVGEFLQALPLVKGSPVKAVGSTPTITAARLRVEVQSAQVTYTGTAAYNDANAPPTLSSQLTDVRTIELARIGFYIKALKIDVAAGARGTAANLADWMGEAAVTFLLRALDAALGRGTGAETVPRFKGLEQLVKSTELNRSEGTLGAGIEKDVRYLLTRVVPTGRGAGAGPDCLLGGPGVLRALMATNTGITGGSGWRLDPRTGLVVYHYLGIPYYRVETLETASDGPIYAASLGPRGVCLVHAYGTAESYGLQVDALPVDPATGMQTFLVHGAHALAIWEPEAIYGITNTPILLQ